MPTPAATSPITVCISATSWTISSSPPSRSIAPASASRSPGEPAGVSSTSASPSRSAKRSSGLPGERVHVGQRDHHGLFEHGLDLHAGARARRAHEADVEPPVLEPAQLLGRAQLAQAQRDLRRLGANGPQQLGDERVHRRAHEADGEPADLAALDAPRLARRVLDRGENVARALQERRPGGGQLDLALVAQQQRRAHLLLEPADLLAQRGLGHVQPFRRAAEVQLFRDGHEVAQMAELHAVIMVAIDEFHAREGTIRLGQLLKAAGLVESGGAAKALLAGGGVTVNGEPEARRGRQLAPGDVVSVGDASVRLT